MTSLLDPTTTRTGVDTQTITPSQRLRTTMAACRVQFTWLGVQKSLTAEQKAHAAEAFDADGPFLSAGKKLLDTRHSAFRAVTAVRGKIDASWKSQTLPFPEPGVRLIRQERVEEFAAQMADLRVELDDAVAELDRHYGELRDAAAEQLGSLYNPADYPTSLVGLFGVTWDFPNVEPPDYLVALSPDLYEQERARVASRFEEAVQLAEQAFLEEFTRLVSHLAERVTDQEGESKVFRDSAVGNLRTFFERFRALNVRSNPQLDDLVAEAQRAVRGVGPQELRDSGSLRRELAQHLSRVQTTLDAMLVDRPRRRILRTPQASNGES